MTGRDRPGERRNRQDARGSIRRNGRHGGTRQGVRHGGGPHAIAPLKAAAVALLLSAGSSSPAAAARMMMHEAGQTAHGTRHEGHAGHAGVKGDKGAEMPMGHGDMKFYMAPAGGTSARFQRTTGHYDVPDGLALRDQRGRPVDLAAELARPGPIVLQFIFTSCATICPVLSASISQAQTELARIAPEVRLISISIDPAYDTPARLARYAARFHAGGNWRFVTGTPDDIRKVIAGFDALLRSNNKMYHRPYNYLRGPDPKAPWVRLEGLIPRRVLLAEFAKVTGRTGGNAERAGVPERETGER